MGVSPKIGRLTIYGGELTGTVNMAVLFLIIYAQHPFLETLANSIDPDQTPLKTPQDVVSDQGLHCLITGISI